MKKRLAWIDADKKPRVHPSVHGDRRTRILRHQKTFLRERSQGASRQDAIKKALKAEHKGMTFAQIRRYELENARLAKKIKGG